MMILKTHIPIRHLSPLFFTVLLVSSFLLGACQPTPLPASGQNGVHSSEILQLTRTEDKVHFIQSSAEFSKLGHQTTPIASLTPSLSPTQLPAEIKITEQPAQPAGARNPTSIIPTLAHPPTKVKRKRSICWYPFTIILACDVQVRAGRKTSLTGGMPQFIARSYPSS